MKFLISIFAVFLFSSFSSHAQECRKSIFPAIKQEMVCMYGQNIGSCGALGDRFSGRQAFKDSAKSAKSFYLESRQSVIGKVVLREIKDQAIQVVEEELVDTAVYQTLKEIGLKYTGRIGAGALVAAQIGRVILRRVSLITSVGSLLVLPDGTSGCSEIRDQYINRATGSCEEDYNFDGRVVGFLTKKASERRKIIRQTWGVCEYYDRFEKTVKEESRGRRVPVSLTCEKDGFVLETKKSDAWVFTDHRAYNVKYNKRSRRKYIAQIDLPNWRGVLYTKYNFKKNGMVKNYDEIRKDAEEINMYKETKMEVFSAYSCCREVAAGRKKCLKNYQ